VVALGNSGQTFGPSEYARAFARLENHYFKNAGFLDVDGQLLRDIPKMDHIPGKIVQGRYDMICPPKSAWTLASHWTNGTIKMVPRAGHALSEVGITAELVRTTDDLAKNPAILDL